MAVSLLPRQILADMFCCLGLGMAVAALHDAASGPIGRFCRDWLAFALAAILLQSFSASRSLSGIPRGYMMLAMLAGAIAYKWAAAPATAELRRWLAWAVTRPFVLVFIPLRVTFGTLWRYGKRQICKIPHFVRKRRKNKLKKTGAVMYNSYI